MTQWKGEFRKKMGYLCVALFRHFITNTFLNSKILPQHYLSLKRHFYVCDIIIVGVAERQREAGWRAGKERKKTHKRFQVNISWPAVTDIVFLIKSRCLWSH